MAKFKVGDKVKLYDKHQAKIRLLPDKNRRDNTNCYLIETTDYGWLPRDRKYWQYLGLNETKKYWWTRGDSLILDTPSKKRKFV